MPKLKFFTLSVLIIASLFYIESQLLPSGKQFAVKKKMIIREQAKQPRLIAEIEDSESLIATTSKSGKLTWKMLSVISYKEKKTREFPDGVLFPKINPQLKARKGSEVTISGYIIPIDEKTFAISKNVMSACFFCGMAGPETIMGIKFKGKTPKLPF